MNSPPCSLVSAIVNGTTSLRKAAQLPNLTFPEIKQGAGESPLDLKRWLYRRGACLPVKKVFAAIADGALGSPIQERIEIVTRIHDAIRSKLLSGGSKATALSRLTQMNVFFCWAEECGYPIEMSAIQRIYIHWTDFLLHRVTVKKDLKPSTVYNWGRVVGQVLDLALSRETPMLELTRLTEPKGRKSPRGAQADKQNLETTFAFGHLLQDICDGLTLSALWGPLPVYIPLRTGGELVQWSGRQTKKRPVLVQRSQYQEHYKQQDVAKRLAAFENDRTLRTRFPLANLRILAELLIFIGQTGMNLAQAHQLTLRHFSYASDVDGYKVRDYKARRGGEVLFEIFREYRSHFERYLDWRRSVFPDDLRLFPLVRATGTATDSRPSFELIQHACQQSGVRWITPTMLRSTRVNWLLRRSGDPELTAEMAQHHKQTLLDNYEVPSQQRAISEVTRFWQQADPTLSRTIPAIPVAPGACDGTPVAVPLKPKAATPPDCVHPSGCLWCEHHRDIDSLDYVWALACFRHLKILEVGWYHPPACSTSVVVPGDYAIKRISEKLSWFKDSNVMRRDWVEEALARVEEGNYHPDWERLIEDVEEAA
jgi:hypothetical protein